MTGTPTYILFEGDLAHTFEVFVQTSSATQIVLLASRTFRGVSARVPRADTIRE
jgi:hypothetical protein